MAFIFIEQGGRTPSKSNYKRTLQIKSNLIRITQDQTGLTGWPILTANTVLVPTRVSRASRQSGSSLSTLHQQPDRVRHARVCGVPDMLGSKTGSELGSYMVSRP